MRQLAAARKKNMARQAALRPCIFNCRPAAASVSQCPKKAVPHLYWGAALLVHELLLAIGYGQQLVFKGRNHAQGFDHVGEVFDDKVHFFLR